MLLYISIFYHNNQNKFGGLIDNFVTVYSAFWLLSNLTNLANTSSTLQLHFQFLISLSFCFVTCWT